LALDNLFHLVRELRFDVLLEPPEHEGSEHLMKTANDQKTLLLIEFELLPSLVLKVRFMSDALEERRRGIEEELWLRWQRGC